MKTQTRAEIPKNFPSIQQDVAYCCTITGDHSKEDHILLDKRGKYIGVCVYRWSYILWPPRNIVMRPAFHESPRAVSVPSVDETQKGLQPALQRHERECRPTNGCATHDTHAKYTRRLKTTA